MLGELPVEARQQRPLPRRRQVLRDLGREDRLAASGRSGDGRAATMQDERAEVGLLVGQLDDAAILPVELDLQGGADLHAIAERGGQRVHALRAERAITSGPLGHDPDDPLAEPTQIVTIDRVSGRRAWMRVPWVRAIGERDPVAVGRAPAIPARLRLQDPDERVHLVTGLVEGILVQPMRAAPAALRPPTRVGVVRDVSALGFEHEDTRLGVCDHEVGLPLHAPREDPVDAVVDDVRLVQLFQEPLVQAALRRALGGEHGERHHPGHGRMLATWCRSGVGDSVRRGASMPLILFVLLAAFAVGLILGGSARSWERMRLHWWGLAPIGVALQTLPVPEGWDSREGIGWAMLVGSYLALLAFVAVNRRVPGAALMAAGLILNLAVVAPNEGMPVSTRAIEIAAGDGTVRFPQDSAKHHLATEDDVLRFLGDVVPIPSPFRIVLSVGDVLLYAGIAWFVVIVTRGDFRENRRPTSGRSPTFRGGKHVPGRRRRRSETPADPAGAGTSGSSP
jgi:Family of unknown function (DUF5317)